MFNTHKIIIYILPFVPGIIFGVVSKEAVNKSFLCYKDSKSSSLVQSFQKENQRKPRPSLILSIPKAGTHLIIHLFELMLKSPRFWGNGNDLAVITNQHIKRIADTGAICVTHAVGNAHNQEMVYSNNLFGIFIIRDPRDQVVSMAHWLHNAPNRVYQHRFDQFSIEQLISMMIEINSQEGPYAFLFKYKNVWPELENFCDVAGLYDLYLPWSDNPNVYTTRFEKLIGPRGGGTLDEQVTEILNIAAHVGVTLSVEQVTRITNHLFGSGMTFYKGKIGAWKNEFTQEHKNAFKRVAGDLLIKLGYEKDLNW